MKKEIKKISWNHLQVISMLTAEEYDTDIRFIIVEHGSVFEASKEVLDEWFKLEEILRKALLETDGDILVELVDNNNIENFYDKRDLGTYNLVQN